MPFDHTFSKINEQYCVKIAKWNMSEASPSKLSKIILP